MRPRGRQPVRDWRENMANWAYAETVLVRVASHCRLAPSGCWEWLMSRTADGYGQVSVKRAMVRVHQVTYLALVGPVPEGLQLDHLCRNRACCNPWHVEPVTPLENTRRGDGPEVIGRRYRDRTECSRGHEYTPENTYIRTRRSGRTSRVCRKCRVIRVIPYQRARRERMRRERNV